MSIHQTLQRRDTHTGSGIDVVVVRNVVVESWTVVESCVDTDMVVIYCVMAGRVTVWAGSVWVTL